MDIKRNRTVYGVLIIIVMILGLLTRRYPTQLPNWLNSYAGDTLWSLMVFIVIGFLFIRLKTKYVALFALVFSYIIEVSQLYHAPWIDAIRHTPLGGLILGFGFLWSDIICYTIGIFLGAFFEIILLKKSNENPK